MFASTRPPNIKRGRAAWRHYGSRARDLLLMTEAHLSMEPNAGMCVALHVLPAGVSYHIRACVPCVCTVSGCSALRRVQICLSPRSPEASSWRRPSVCFVLTSPLLTIPKRPLLSEWGRGGKVCDGLRYPVFS